MSAQPRPDKRFTEAEYLALDRASDTKHEFIDGEIVAMSGASEKHNLITISIGAHLYMRLRGRPCRTYMADMRVQVSQSGQYVYPDLSALCGEPRFADDKADVLLNPQLIVEVLSPSTAEFDRGRKALMYRSLDSLVDYLIVWQDAPRVEHYSRQPDDSWSIRTLQGLGVNIALHSLTVTLPLADVYEQITWPDADPDAS